MNTVKRVQAEALDERRQALKDIEACLGEAVTYLVDLAGAKPDKNSPNNCRKRIDEARFYARHLASLSEAPAVPEVTDAMVTQALLAYEQQCRYDATTKTKAMRLALEAALAAPPAPTAAVDGEVQPAERNKLVIDAYRAMDAIDAIRKWCDEQKYGNDTITVSRLLDMLPAVIRERPQQFNVNTLVNKLRSKWGFGPSARSTLPVEWQGALDEAADALAALSPGTAEEERP